MLLLALMLPACDTEPVVTPDVSITQGDGLFLHGCPVAGASRARLIQDVAERPWGTESLAGPGDALLMNAHAAFVIQGVDDVDTYYHYGGAPIDAVAVDGCEQAGPELLEEIGFVVGQLDLTDFNASSLHQVRGESIEVVNDGSDGNAAVVEVHATDDRFWLVELTLIRGTFNDGGRKELDALYGLDITLRYTLPPDASALQMEVVLDGEPVTDGFMVGALVFPSDETEVSAFSTSSVGVGGFGLVLGVPWLAMGDSSGAQAVGMPGANMAYTSVAGVRALLDANQAFVPSNVIGAAEPPTTPFLLGVGATDANSAAETLEPWHEEPLGPGIPFGWAEVQGAVVDEGGPVAGADVSLYAAGENGSWTLLDRFVSDPHGQFSGRTLDTGSTWRLVASTTDRDESDELLIEPGSQAFLRLGRPGALRMDLEDEAGVPSPARIELEREDGRVEVRYALPGDVLPLPPGTWHAWATRGYEFDPVEADIVVPDGGEGVLSGTLVHRVDTRGWASVDTHVHAEASADSDTVNADRFRTVAASGLDVIVSTDHEAIIDMQPALDGLDLADTLAYGLGSEVTATVPEHINAWPFPVESGDPRGNPVRWYGLGFPGIYERIRARGARVIQLNHSRVNGECGILCVLDWDRLTDPPTLDDAPALGLPEGTEIWSWDFDAFEVQNGLRSPLPDPNDPRHSGALLDWLSFINLGHPVTGTAVTDVHGLQIPGEPRTYVRVPDDTPGVVTADDVADGELGGGAVISSGGFATVEIAGAGPGELANGGDAIRVRATGISAIDLTDVYVLVDCDLAATVATTDPYGVVKLDATVPLSLGADASVVVVGFGREAMPRGFDGYDAATVPRFLTNPIYVDADRDGVWTAPGPKACATGLGIGERVPAG